MAKPKKPKVVTIAVDQRTIPDSPLEPVAIDMEATYKRAEDLLCVHRKWGDEKAWSVTHARTGMTAGDGFIRKGDAQAFVDAVRHLPWAWGEFGSSAERPEGLREELLKVRAGWPTIGVKVAEEAPPEVPEEENPGG